MPSPENSEAAYSIAFFTFGTFNRDPGLLYKARELESFYDKSGVLLHRLSITAVSGPKSLKPGQEITLQGKLHRVDAILDRTASQKPVLEDLGDLTISYNPKSPTYWMDQIDTILEAAEFYADSTPKEQRRNIPS